ncbi:MULTISPECIES: hypothetical protein [unclassified Sphingobacterium]|uniref:hypothetical protein n=1 Tax=unclassified Sphingobacterium TaxID=2609468 RepID=UPI0025E7238F|nr:MULTISPECIES: hypothetical protein [unclassified Sphingobacterium]
MRNFFLFKDALHTATLEDFEIGVSSLNEVVANRDSKKDRFIRYEDFWSQESSHGFFYELPEKLNKEYIGLTLKLFNSFVPIPIDILNEGDYDILYDGDCNGFKGFDFAPTTVSANRQVTGLTSFNLFKGNCANQKGYASLEAFWAHKESLFPNIIFCERVWDQISHLSVNDDRFNLINERLKKLNSFTGLWKTGNFEYKNLGLDNSPDTPTRIANTLALRTFNCPNIGNKVFSLHIKWSHGREFFRLYYYPNQSDHKVYVGYIGPKADIGF